MKKFFVLLASAVMAANLFAGNFGILVNSKTYFAGTQVAEFNGYVQYLAHVKLKAGDYCQLYDEDSKAVWAVDLNTASVDGFTRNNDKYRVSVGGCFDFYIKLKFEQDELYIGPGSDCGSGVDISGQGSQSDPMSLNAKSAFLLLESSISNLPTEESVIEGEDNIAENPEQNAANWYNAQFVNKNMGVFIKKNEISSALANGISCIWVNIDRVGLDDIKTAGISDAVIADLKAFVKAGGNLFLTKQATMIAHRIGRIYEPTFNNGGYNIGGTLWTISPYLGLGYGIPQEGKRDNSDHPVFKDVEWDNTIYTYKKSEEAEPEPYNVLPLAGDNRRTDNNCMWIELYRKDPENPTEWLRADDAEARGVEVHYANDNALRLQEFESDWNVSMLACWGQVLDYCSAGLVEMHPEGDFKGIVMGLGFSAYQWGSSNADYIGNVKKLTKNCINYLTDGENAQVPSDDMLTSGTYYTAVCSYLAYTSDGWTDKTSDIPSIEVNVKGNNVTIVGLSRYFPNAAIQGTMVDNTITFTSGQFLGTKDNGNIYLVGSNDSETACDIVFVYNPGSKALTTNTRYIVESDNANAVSFDTYWYYAAFSAEALVISEKTIRLNSLSFDLNSIYLHVWTGNSNYNADDVEFLVSSGWMTLTEEGWWTGSFKVIEGTSFYVGFVYFNDNQGDPSIMYDGNAYSESTCFEYNDGIQPIECSTFPSGVISVHVTTPGTLGQLMVKELGELTWTDVKALIVTGSLNETDMSYFYRMTNLQLLNLSGTNITNIGGCKDLAKLKTVVLPATCTAVNDNAFSGCTRLRSINISNIQSVGNYAFYKCGALAELNMPHVLSVGDHAFAMDDDYYYSFDDDYYYSFFNLPAFLIVNMPIVQTIGNYAFNAHVFLASITMPLVTSIGKYAFCNCQALAQVDLSNVTNLGEGAFYMYDYSNYSSDLSQVILSEELENIPSQCFYGCNKLISISFPAALKSIGNNALPYLTSVELPSSITSVGSGNFSNATSITIPAKVTSWDSFSSNWQDVYCYVAAPQTWTAFNNDNVSSATLHVPAVSLAAYKLHDNWYHFGKIVPIDGDVDELIINSDLTLITTDGIANKANVTINENGALTISAENTLAAGNYEQMLSSINKRYSYGYDANGNGYYYSYMPYTGMLLANSAITADNVNVRLVPTSNRWNFFSLPFDVNMSDITLETEGTGTVGTSQWVIREYSGANRASGEGNTWNNVPANSMLHANKGYILYWAVEGSSSTNSSFYYYFNMPAVHNANMQKIFATDDVNVPLTEYSAEFPQNRSWNLVGNPYPCSFDIRQMDFDAPITTWNGTGYVAYTTTDDNYTLRPAEAFFVQAPQGTTHITFHKEGRSTLNKQEVTQEEYYNYSAPKRSQASNSVREVFNFTLSNTDYTDRARLVLNAQASADYELTRDAAKMMSSDNTVPQLYIFDNGIRYAINERPEHDTYTMGAYVGKAGEYTLHLDVQQNEKRQIYVTDTQSQITTDLTLGDYTFTSEEGTFDNRFVITFVQHMPTGMEETDLLTVPMKTIENGQLILVTPQGKKYTVGGKAL